MRPNCRSLKELPRKAQFVPWVTIVFQTSHCDEAVTDTKLRPITDREDNPKWLWRRSTATISCLVWQSFRSDSKMIETLIHPHLSIQQEMYVEEKKLGTESIPQAWPDTKNAPLHNHFLEIFWRVSQNVFSRGVKKVTAIGTSNIAELLQVPFLFSQSAGKMEMLLVYERSILGL